MFAYRFYLPGAAAVFTEHSQRLADARGSASRSFRDEGR